MLCAAGVTPLDTVDRCALWRLFNARGLRALDRGTSCSVPVDTSAVESDSRTRGNLTPPHPQDAATPWDVVTLFRLISHWQLSSSFVLANLSHGHVS